MAELDLDRVRSCLIWELKTLAAIRMMCVEQGIESSWCEDLEGNTAKLVRSVQEVIEAKGNVLVVKPKG